MYCIQATQSYGDSIMHTLWPRSPCGYAPLNQSACEISQDNLHMSVILQQNASAQLLVLLLVVVLVPITYTEQRNPVSKPGQGVPQVTGLQMQVPFCIL